MARMCPGGQSHVVKGDEHNSVRFLGLDGAVYIYISHKEIK